MIEDVPGALVALIERTGSNLSALSMMLGRNRAYLHQFVTRGTPKRLDDRDRRALADFFGVDEEELGAPPRPALIRIPRLAVEAAAGIGRHVDTEMTLGAYTFEHAWLRRLTHSAPRDLSIIQVMGESMAPTLNDGDDVMVDGSPDQRLRDGVHVLRRDDTLMVKRLSLAPTGTLTISSDNPTHPTWHDCVPSSITVIGRVIWASRRLS